MTNYIQPCLGPGCETYVDGHGEPYCSDKCKRSDLFYIQNKGFVGNCLVWWRPLQTGYTTNLDDAGKYTREQALAIIKIRPNEDLAWPVDYIDSLAQRHVNVTNHHRRLQ